MNTKYLTDAAQDAAEIDEFCGVLRIEAVRSFLEIGSRYGGSLWRAANVLPKGSRIVSVELATGYGGRGDGPQNLQACIDALRRDGYDAHVIWGESTASETVEQVRALGPFDAVFIDADHRLPSCTRDFVNYGQMGKIVAFHDIGWSRPPGYDGTVIDVPLLWSALKDGRRYREIKHCPTGRNNGIGVLWRD